MRFGGNHAHELVSRLVALYGGLREDVNYQRNQCACLDGFRQFGRVAFKVFEQAGDVALESEWRKADGQGGGGVNPVAGAGGGLAVEQDGHFGIGSQAAGCLD